MISLGGVIGTGPLFVSSGYAIHQAGPLGAISLTRPAPLSSAA